MDIAEARAQNRAKQRTFRKKHKSAIAAAAKHRHIMSFQPPLPTATYRVYELADPREPDLPVFVGYGKASLQPPWGALWALRNVSNGRWALWMRELESLNLTPLAVSVIGWPVRWRDDGVLFDCGSSRYAAWPAARPRGFYRRGIAPAGMGGRLAAYILTAR